MVLELQFMYNFNVVFFIYILCVCLCGVNTAVCVYIYIDIYIDIVGLYPTDINFMFSTILKYISGILDLSLFFTILRLC